LKAPIGRLYRLEFLCNCAQSFGPRGRFKVAALANHWRLHAFRTVHEVESVAALHAQELAVDSGMIAVISTNDRVVSNSERGLAAIAAMRADRADVLHLPGPGLVPVSPTRERANGTDIDAHSALIALQVIVVVRNDLGT
jgi:hypothetical protein